jgi:DNA-binding GntR family transcriptional regulator
MAEKLQRGPERAAPPYERIKQAILDGSLQPGEALVESTLGGWIGVSRTPVREALGRLEQDGLVVRTDRGMAVRARTPEEVLDIYEVRISLEATAARMAAARHTELDQVRLERELALAEALDLGDGDALVHRNREFHRMVWLSSHNESLIDLLNRLNLHLLRYPATTLIAPGRWEEALVEHRELVEAIVAADGARAQAVAEHHFTTARDIRLALWADGVE